MEDLDPKKSLIKKYELRYLSTLSQIFEHTENGKKLLKAWTEMYMFKPIVPMELISKDSAMYYAFIREGENRVIRSIMTDLKRFNIYKETLDE